MTESPATVRADLVGALADSVLFVAALVVYWPALSAGYVWDDHVYIENNPLLQDGGGLAKLWFSGEPIDYWPITYSSFWLERRVWGLDPFASHVANVVLHSLAAMLLWRLLARLGLRWAWLAAWVFVVHPLNVDAVASMFQRKTILAGLFSFASLLAWLRFRDRSSRAWLVLALSLFALALLSKTSPVMLPVAIGLIVYWHTGRFTRADARQVVAFAGVAVVLGGVAWWFQVRSLHYDSFEPDTVVARLAAAGQALRFYFEKSVWPEGLSVIYPRRAIDQRAPGEYLATLGFVLVCLLTWWKRSTWGRGGVVAPLMFAASLLPVLGFTDITYFNFSRVADRFAYLALPVVLASACHLLGRVMGAPTPIASVLAAAVVAGAGTVAFRHAFTYNDESRLWRNVVERYPEHWVGWGNLGAYLADRGRQDEAASHLRRALELAPDNPVVNYNLGIVETGAGRLASAEEHYRRALERGTELSAPRVNLARLLAARGELVAAEAELRHALALEPRARVVRFNLAVVLLERANLEEADELLAGVLDDEPRFVRGHVARALVALARSDVVSARIHLQRASALEPGTPEVLAAKARLDRATDPSDSTSTRASTPSGR
jgi:Flp pilus assembly protein TadD